MTDRQRILIVDDERQITRVLTRSLNANGYEVHVASDGELALQTLKDWPPDLIITDLAMPNVGGLELCRRVRSFSDARAAAAWLAIQLHPRDSPSRG